MYALALLKDALGSPSPVSVRPNDGTAAGGADVAGEGAVGVATAAEAGSEIAEEQLLQLLWMHQPKQQLRVLLLASQLEMHLQRQLHGQEQQVAVARVLKYKGCSA